MFKLRNFITAICLIALSLPTVFAAQPPIGNHQPKVYESPEGLLFINKKLPLYFSFSTTTGPNAKLHALKPDANGYGAPLFLDSEGINFLRTKWAVDPESQKTINPKREVMYELYADGEAPKTTVEFKVAPDYMDEATGEYFGKGLQIHLTAVDKISGVDKIFYSLSSTNFRPYDGPIDVPAERAYEFYFYSVDHVGNVEKVSEIRQSFIVDITSPKSVYKVGGTVYRGNVLGSNADLGLKASDRLSGEAAIYYSIDGGPRRLYRGGNLDLSALADGEHQIDYYAIDNVNNIEERNTYKFYYDITSPESNYEIMGDQHKKGSTMFISPRTKIKLEAKDNFAGVNRLRWSIDKTGETAYNGPFQVTNKLGFREIGFYAVDNVENVPARTNLKLYLDNVAPISELVFAEPTFTARDTLFVCNRTKISVYSRDGESGVKAQQYAVQNKQFNLYNGSFVLNREGFNMIYFSAQDNVMNEEEIKSKKVFVDNSAPRIFANFSVNPVGKNNREGKEVNVYPNYVRLFLGATDRFVGTERIEYSFDGKNFDLYSSPQTIDISETNAFARESLYSVTVRAYDKLGNMAEETIEFYVGR